MDYKRINLEFKSNIVILTLNHPEVLNAVSTEMMIELTNAISRIENLDNGARCLLITGSGRGFCAGGNPTDPQRNKDVPEKSDNRDLLRTWFNPFFLRLRDLQMPCITAVNGPAVGVGMSLALSGDLILAARSAYFLQGFSRMGRVPDGGSTFLLPRLIGIARSMELSMLNERIQAEKALEWGMINRVFDDDKLIDKALKIAEELAEGPTVAYALMRKAYWQSLSNTYQSQLDLEAGYQRKIHLTEDAKEGPLAFLEKRNPRFLGH